MATRTVDDLFNDWGVCLIDPAPKSSTRGIDPTIPSDMDDNYQKLANKVQSMTKQMYTLHSVESCGSTANSLAILELTKGSPNACVYAVGSYIAGNNGYLHALSLNSRQLENHGLVLPQRSQDATPDQIKSCVTLPYYIPSGKDIHKFRKMEGCMEMNEEDIGCLSNYEDSCLLSLHVILLARRIQDNPIRVLLFEPILAGCGGILSMRCYKILARLAQIHGFVFLVDEILSFGRMGYARGFYAMEHFPREMHQYTSMITIGKWIGNGAILKKVGANDSGLFATKDSFPRVVSTKINVTNMLQTWNAVFSKVGVMRDWRAHVLDYLGVTKESKPESYNEHHWGDGLLIFLSGKLDRKGHTSGFHSRLLPKVNSDVGQIKNILTAANKGAFRLVKGWDRQTINRDLVATIRGYCYPQVSVVLPIPYQISLHLCYEFQKLGIHHRDPPARRHNEKKHTAYDFSFDELIEAVKNSGIGDGHMNDSQYRSKTTAVCNQAKAILCRKRPSEKFAQPDILVQKKVGNSRHVVWRAGPSMVYWQQLLDDDVEEEDISIHPIAGKLICSCTACSILMRNVKKQGIEKKGTKRKKEHGEVDSEEVGAILAQIPVNATKGVTNLEESFGSSKTVSHTTMREEVTNKKGEKKTKMKESEYTSLSSLEVSATNRKGSKLTKKTERAYSSSSSVKKSVTTKHGRSTKKQKTAYTSRKTVDEAPNSSDDEGYETQTPNYRQEESDSEASGNRKPAAKPKK